jgi:hypothetical protein
LLKSNLTLSSKKASLDQKQALFSSICSLRHCWKTTITLQPQTVQLLQVHSFQFRNKFFVQVFLQLLILMTYWSLWLLRLGHADRPNIKLS